MRTKGTILAIFLLLICHLMTAQSLSRSVVSIAGNTTEKDGYYLSNSVGEAIVSTVKVSFHFLTQGFQQPSLIHDSPELPPEPLDAIDVYPNPVHDDLIVSFRIVELKTYHLLVVDAMGRILLRKEYNSMKSRDEIIDFSSFSPGLYLIHVYSDNMKMNRVFKIEKL